MYWKTGNNQRAATITIAGYIMGTDRGVSLTLYTETSAVSGAYLFTSSPEGEGIISAKRHTESEYAPVMGPLDASCWLGELPASSEILIDFLINVPIGQSDGYRCVPIFIGYGGGPVRSSDLFLSDWLTEPWLQDWSDNWE